MNCPNCKNPEFLDFFKSYSQVHYKRCNNCRCVYQDPIIKLNYSDNYWQGAIDPDGVTRNFLNERKFKIDNWYGDTIDFVNSYEKKDFSVLDLGCGLGYFLSALNTNFKKCGIEDSDFACDYIRENFKDIEIINGDYNKIENFKIKFDVIMFYHVIEHLNDPIHSIELIKKSLKKDGILIIGTPNVDSFVSRLFKERFRHYIPAHICLYGEKSLKKMLSQHEIEVFKIEKPFFKTTYNSISNYLKMFNLKKISPAFYGSIMTFYCKVR
jgi:SAM-dependent methyltransferase